MNPSILHSRERVNSEYPNTMDTNTTSDFCRQTQIYWQLIISTRMSNVRKPMGADDKKASMVVTRNTVPKPRETASGAEIPAIGSRTARSRIRRSREKLSAVSVS